MTDSILALINNDAGHYRGDVHAYFPILFAAPNDDNPYHNFRHLFYVAEQVLDAIGFYHLDQELGLEHTRALLIAALFHDFGHPGMVGSDEKNIAIAVAGIERYIEPSDRALLPLIIECIRTTKYPYGDDTPPLSMQIMRDADLSQSFDDVWIQQSVFGLAKESGMPARTFLEGQPAFLSSITFYTEWAKQKFGARQQMRIEEVKELLALLPQ